MSKQIDLNKYKDFVQAVTSDASNYVDVYVNRINELQSSQNVNVALLTTAAIGLGSESGEFSEIVKKFLFQGKPVSDENLAKLKSELGDIIWYWTNACRSLNLDPNEVIADNVKKLEARYPNGQFDPFYSENRKNEAN